MMTNVADSLLDNSIYLYLLAWIQVEMLFEFVGAGKLVFKFTLDRQMRDCVGERPFKRCTQAYISQHRWAEVFANMSNLSRNRFYLTTKDCRINRTLSIIRILRDLVCQQH